MYKVITIGKKDYKLEYSIEASLYQDCTESVFDFFSKVSESNDVKSSIKGIASIPNTTLTLFYAGLMEHHGESGDCTVMNKTDAKRLLTQLIKETQSKEDTEDKSLGSFYGVLNMIFEQMGEDVFFDLIGMTDMMETAEMEQTKVTKMPQDHKRKATKTKS